MTAPKERPEDEPIPGQMTVDECIEVAEQEERE